MNKSKDLPWVLKKFLQNYWIIFVIFLLAFIFRIYLIATRVFPAGDEIWAYFLIQKSYKDIFYASFSDLHAPFYFLFLHFIKPNMTILQMRLVSLVFDILGMVAIYKVARTLFNYRISIIALLLMAFMPAAVWPAVFGRYYSFLILLSILNLYAFWRYLTTKKIRYLVVFCIFNLLGTYTHYYFFLYPCAFAFFLLVKKTFFQNKKLLLGYGLQVLGSIPILYFFILLPKPEFAGRHANDLLKLPAAFVVNVISWEVIIFSYFNLHFYLGVLLAFVTLMCVSFYLYKIFSKEPTELDLLLFSLFVIPVLVIVIFAYSIWPLFSLSSLQVFMVPFLLLLAKGISIVRFRTINIVFLLCVLAGLFVLILSSYSYRKPSEDFSLIFKNFREGDVIVHTHIYSFLMGKYYFGDSANYSVGEAISASNVTSEVLGYNAVLNKDLSRVKRLWYIGEAYDNRKVIGNFRENLEKNFILLEADDKTVGNRFQDNDFNVYLYGKN